MRRTFFACAVLVAGCADDRSADLIVAAEGGTVESDAFRVEIAPDALAEDTAVELSVGDAADYPSMTGEYQVLVIEPEGTVLETPAEVTIDASFIGAADGETVTLSQLGPAGWVRLEHTDNGDGSATTFVSEFAPIAVSVAAASSTGSIEGTLSWNDGSPVDGAPVMLMQGATHIGSSTTDATGAFGFADVEPGTYTLVVELECPLMADISVAAGAPTQADLTLCPAP